MKFEKWNSKTILPGQRYGRLLVLSTHKEKQRKYQYFAKCQCDCGSAPVYVRPNSLRAKRKGTHVPTESCGCLKEEMQTKHGECHTPIYHVWENMIQRCTNKNHKHYHRYGGRGITVCKGWLVAANFIKDMKPGYKKGLTMERSDNNLGYFPKNCKWANRQAQSRNRKACIYLTYQGQTKCITEWGEELGIKHRTLRDRIKVLGWSPEKALSTPVNRYVRKPQ
ncbi:MAG TPA: hypothetical protein ENI27_06215 [bacterium]|nr:hypothetical protein [bacterium]